MQGMGPFMKALEQYCRVLHYSEAYQSKLVTHVCMHVSLNRGNYFHHRKFSE